jgi:hypothetical protein
MAAVRRLEQKLPAGAQNAGNLAKDLVGVVQMFHHVVSDNDIETSIGIGDFACVRDPPLIQKRVLFDPRIKVDAADLPGQLAEIHRLQYPSACAKIQKAGLRSDDLQNTLTEQLVIPVLLVIRVEPAIDALDHTHCRTASASLMVTSLVSMISARETGAASLPVTEARKAATKASVPLSCRHRFILEKPGHPQPRSFSK